MQHTMPVRPWSKLGVNIANLDGQLLLVCVDYYSSYIEIGRLSSLTTQAVTCLLTEWMACHSIPNEVVSDNGHQFAPEDFQKFMHNWDFVHTTSSLLYPQSNSKAENAVGIVKQLFKKATESGFSEYHTLLDWRNMPTEGVGSSPAKRLFGR